MLLVMDDGADVVLNIGETIQMLSFTDNNMVFGGNAKRLGQAFKQANWNSEFEF